MIRSVAFTVLALLCLTGVSPAHASATDHSGFGHNLFASRAPAGFGDPVAYTDNMDAAAAMANDIEPASGATGVKPSATITR